MVIDIDSYQKTIKEYDCQIMEFTEIANELNITLRQVVYEEQLDLKKCLSI